jgi:hypothetical protein
VQSTEYCNTIGCRYYLGNDFMLHIVATLEPWNEFEGHDMYVPSQTSLATSPSYSTVERISLKSAKQYWWTLNTLLQPLSNQARTMPIRRKKIVRMRVPLDLLPPGKDSGLCRSRKKQCLLRSWSLWWKPRIRHIPSCNQRLMTMFKMIRSYKSKIS